MKKPYIWRGLCTLLVLVLSLTMFGQSLAFTREGDVNLFLGTLPPAVQVTGDTNYYPSSYASMDEMRAALKDHLIESQEEGSVLLRNENGALPLAPNASVTLFGFAAATPVYHGGSGGPPNEGINLYDAMKEEGFQVNETVYNAIVAANGSRTKTGLIGEIPASAYAGTEGSYASSYNDAAIYVMSRFGGEEEGSGEKKLSFDKLVINLDSYELLVDGKRVDTPPKELELLYHLAASPNRVFTRNQLLDEVWGFDYFGDSRTVDVHIKRLREKLEGVSEQWSLKTVWGVGYKFEVVSGA